MTSPRHHQRSADQQDDAQHLVRRQAPQDRAAPATRSGDARKADGNSAVGVAATEGPAGLTGAGVWKPIRREDVSPEQARRFWNSVDSSGGPDACWIWKPTGRKGGYARFRIGGVFQAHRVAAALAWGEVGAGTLIMHRCDVRDCVNPAHLSPGTFAANNADMMAKGRGRHPIGQRNGASKLTDACVLRIRERLAAKETLKAIAQDYGVNWSVIGRIARREAWRHV